MVTEDGGTGAGKDCGGVHLFEAFAPPGFGEAFNGAEVVVKIIAEEDQPIGSHF